MSLTREAYDKVREAIVSGALEFGEHLSEAQIANALGMSKAPVRAAFMELRDKGLVNIVPQSGTYVFSPTPEDVRTLSRFRWLLENEALHEAMRSNPAQVLAKLDDAVARMKRAWPAKDWNFYRKADSSFHFAFLEESGNPHLLRAYHLTADALEALRVHSQGGRNNSRERSFYQHIEMAELLRAGKIKEAAGILQSHILVINDFLDTFSLKPSRPSRKGLAPGRSYADVFGLSDPRGREIVSDLAASAAIGRRGVQPRSREVSMRRDTTPRRSKP
jgi:DNA-binding GntR family transcriptional regulator